MTIDDDKDGEKKPQHQDKLKILIKKKKKPWSNRIKMKIMKISQKKICSTTSKNEDKNENQNNDKDMIQHKLHLLPRASAHH